MCKNKKDIHISKYVLLLKLLVIYAMFVPPTGLPWLKLGENTLFYDMNLQYISLILVEDGS